MKFLKYLGFIIILMYALIGCNKHLEKTESEQLNEEPTMKPIEQSENTQTITVPEYKYRQKLNIIDDNYRTYYECFYIHFMIVTEMASVILMV